MTTIPNDHMSGWEAKPLSTECGMNDSILTDVISRVREWQCGVSTAPGSGEIRADLTWLKGRSDSLLQGRSSLLEISQDGFCKSWILNFLELVGERQSSALIGYSPSIPSPESLILLTDTVF